MGLPYAFASHFAPAQLMAALRIYRENFQASSQLDKPYVIACCQVVVAETDGEADLLATTLKRLILGIITRKRELMQQPDEQFDESALGFFQHDVNQMLAYALIGGRKKVKQKLKTFLEMTQADEIMATSHIYDHQKRVNSYRMFSEIMVGIQDESG
jgi:alkanesulfonate monooxygenase SsuD/methylene tetrahydromethanopterin reductase-like flavin-dependent oxidoreductase (luciferase family)